MIPWITTAPPDDRKHRSHRFLAANNFVPALLHLDGADKHVQLTDELAAGPHRHPGDS